MKIKTFQAGTLLELESQIQQWLTGNPNIEIIDVQFDFVESKAAIVYRDSAL